MLRLNKKKILYLLTAVAFLSYPSYKISRLYYEVSNSYLCDKQIIVFESDDWGMCGVRDREGFDNLRSKGYNLGKDERDYYSLETVEDLEKLYETLLKHRDSKGDHPIFTFNFIVTNPDFKEISKHGFKAYFYRKLSDGFPQLWDRENLFRRYLRGIKLGIVYPGYHGKEHFNYMVWLNLLKNGDIATLDLFQEEMVFGYRPVWNQIKSPYIDNSILPSRFINYSQQRQIIRDGVAVFEELFGFTPETTIAPDYCWNSDTENVWSEVGIKFIQAGNRQSRGYYKDGKGIRQRGYRLGEMNRRGIVYLTRNADFEPWVNAFDLGEILDRIDVLLKIGEPVIISTHNINYVSSIKNFRDNTLAQLDRMLTFLEKRYLDLLYLTDAQLGDAILHGYFETLNGEKINVNRKNSISQYLSATVTLFWYKVRIKIFKIFKAIRWLKNGK